MEAIEIVETMQKSILFIQTTYSTVRLAQAA